MSVQRRLAEVPTFGISQRFSSIEGLKWKACHFCHSRIAFLNYCCTKFAIKIQKIIWPRCIALAECAIGNE